MTEYSKELIADLVQGRLGLDEYNRLQRQEKDPDRRSKVLAVEQERLGWDTPILVCLQEHLYVVEEHTGERVVRCGCGHRFGDYQINWKENALLRERNPRDYEVYQGPRAADPDWHRLREFYCPNCAALLDVEMVPTGYPFIFNFLPDLEATEEEGAD